MHFRTCFYTDRGGRDNNEDCGGYRVTDGQYGLWVLCDGLGGQAAGETASRAVVQSVMEQYEAAPVLDKAHIVSILSKANQLLLDKQAADAGLRGMASTFAGLFTDGRSALCAYVGDTRLYYFQQHRLAYQTEDHSAAQLAVLAGDIPAGQIRFHEDRNKLLRVMGGGDSVKASGLEQRFLPQVGDAFLLCSDGFWEYVHEEEMEAELAGAASPQQWLERMLVQLRARVPQNHDNLSAIGVFVEP